MERSHGRLPIFTDKDLKADLEALGPYFCKGRCVKIEEDLAKEKAAWDALSPAEKQAEVDKITRIFEAVIEAIREEGGEPCPSSK